MEDNKAAINENVLHDNCDEWTAPKGAIIDDAKLILHLGCHKKITSFQLKNLNKDLGGTKTFSLYVAKTISGPWILIATEQLTQTDTCSEEVVTFRIYWE